jgi:hypothetical protein
VPQRKGEGVPADGVHTPHGQKAMPQLMIFPDRLLARLSQLTGSSGNFAFRRQR